MAIGDLYRKAYGALIAKPTNFGWVQAGKIAASGRPYSIKEMDFLLKQGVRSVLSLTEEPLANDLISGRGLRYKNILIRNHEAPDSKQLDEVVGFIHSSIADALPVLVHCAAGLGRTGTALAAYFMATGYSAQDAITYVRRMRPGSIEPGQAVALEKYQNKGTAENIS